MQTKWNFINITHVKKLISALTYKKHKFFFVGGCVRDSILGLSVHDFDIASNLDPETNIKHLKSIGIKVIPTGISYGTVTAIVDDIEFQITTFRKDIETFGRKAKTKQTNNLIEDAKRRDFTFNALYLDPHTLEVIDYFNGIHHLYSGNVEFIGDADQRINEDFLRILRYFRFYAKFSKQPCSSYIKQTLIKHSNKLILLSKERLSTELEKILLLPSANVMKSLKLMSDTKIMDDFFQINQEILIDTKLDDMYGFIQMYKINDSSIKNILILALIINSKTINYKNVEKLLLRKKDFKLLLKLISIKDILYKYRLLEFTEISQLTAEYGYTIIKLSLILVAVLLPNNKHYIINTINKLIKNSMNSFEITGNDIKNLNIIKDEKNIGIVIKKLKTYYWMGHIMSNEDYIAKAKNIIENNNY